MERQNKNEAKRPLTLDRRSFVAGAAFTALGGFGRGVARADALNSRGSDELATPEPVKWESYGERVKKFEINLEQAPTPEAYLELFVSRLQAALTHDCTPEKAYRYAYNLSHPSGDALINATNDFDPAIIKGMFGLLDDVTPSDIVRHPLYRILRDAHQGVTMHYNDYLKQSGEEETFTIGMLDSAIYLPESGNAPFSARIDLSAANDLTDNDPLKATHDVAIEGTILVVDVNPTVRQDGVYRASMSYRGQDLVPLNELANLAN